MHLSHVAQYAWFGFYGTVDVAVIEVAGITEDGRLIPSSSVGNNKTWLDQADKVILEVNSLAARGDGGHARHLLRHRAAARTASRSDADRRRRPHRRALPARATRTRSSRSSRPTPQTATRRSPPPDADSQADRRPPAGLPATTRSAAGRLTPTAAAAAVRRRQHRQRGARRAWPQAATGGLTAYTEVIQDGMLRLLKVGTLRWPRPPPSR